MKKSYIYIVFILATLWMGVSCSDFLEESPKNSQNANGVFVTTRGFDSGLNGLHAYARLEFETWSDTLVSQGACPYEILQVGTDICEVAMGDGTLTPFENYAFNASNSYVKNRWKWAYGLIASANTMLTHSEKTTVAWDKDTDKVFFQANARFFRAYAYRYLTYLYGDVPWVTIVENEYRTDFERTPKAEVLAHMIEDLEFAIKYLPESPSSVKDGQLTKWAALHMLSEICLFSGNNARAESAAKEIINSNYYSLMSTRFGSEIAAPGDVFSDMFKDKNFNRGGGNNESIWVIQSEYQTVGGSTKYSDWTRRAWVPAYFNIAGFMISPEYGGRGLGQIRPMNWWLNTYEPNDIRGSEYNVRRDFYYNDPSKTELFGKKHTITQDNINRGQCYPSTTKFDYGVKLDPTFEGNMKDKYRFRLAETYLLLAEACINQNNIAGATDAINAVRQRSGATLATTAQVNMDYLLDERARELLGEEMRRFTLARTNKLVDRVKNYNPKSASDIQDYNALWPIPQEVIDANSGKIWTNNPGYN